MEFGRTLVYELCYHKLIKRQSCYRIETSQFICFANQLTGFQMMATLVFNELNGKISAQWIINKHDKWYILKLWKSFMKVYCLPASRSRHWSEYKYQNINISWKRQKKKYMKRYTKSKTKPFSQLQLEENVHATLFHPWFL